MLAARKAEGRLAENANVDGGHLRVLRRFLNMTSDAYVHGAYERELIKRFIAGCDDFVVIIGGRYGSKGPTGKSYTEMEYDYAVEAGLPVLAFLHGDPGKITADKTEVTDEGKAALKSFREKIEAARHAKYWTVSKELSGLVALGMLYLMRIKPRAGWVRADQVADESAAQEILRLTVEERETNMPAVGRPMQKIQDRFTLQQLAWLAAGRGGIN